MTFLTRQHLVVSLHRSRTYHRLSGDSLHRHSQCLLTVITDYQLVILNICGQLTIRRRHLWGCDDCRHHTQHQCTYCNYSSHLLLLLVKSGDILHGVCLSF